MRRSYERSVHENVGTSQHLQVPLGFDSTAITERNRSGKLPNIRADTPKVMVMSPVAMMRFVTPIRRTSGMSKPAPAKQRTGNEERKET